jgi:hypothetical protein
MAHEFYFTNERSHIIARVALDPAKARGAGGPGYPRLIFGLNWKLSAHGNSGGDQWIVSASAKLFVGQDYDRIADSLVSHLHFSLKAIESEGTSELEFPLDRYRIELLEQRRNGGDINLRMDIHIVHARFGERVHFGKPDAKLLPTALDFEIPSQTSVNLQVPQSVWIKTVLPGLGYGVIHVLEFPAVALDACNKLEKPYAALQRAHTKFTAGEYDEAIWQCRTAVDPLRTELKKIKDGNPDSLSADWAEKIGPATVDWLLTFFGKTHGVANTPAHSPHIGHFSRLDAQMVLTVTTGVIAYVARTKGGG